MERAVLDRLLDPYNPWWSTTAGAAFAGSLPVYERPVVEDVLCDLEELRQAVSITGPRRVGKSTALWQIIRKLIEDQNIPPSRLLYFSFDDPQVMGSRELQDVLFDELVERMAGDPPGYLFLDEVQRLPRWELFVKKHYDLRTPVRFVVSGSASSPIFRSSQESLLGRVKDRHLLPFRFREFCLYRLGDEPGFKEALGRASGLKAALLAGDGEAVVANTTDLDRSLGPYRHAIDEAVRDYCRDGGFPEVWDLNDPVRKIEYLMEQQVRKVLYEDLMMLTKYRKPENILRFFVYLLGHPGVEINPAKIAQEADLSRKVIDDNFPRLEMTDLIIRIPKFSPKPLRVRQGNVKVYPVDIALRNAVLKTWEPVVPPMGIHAESLVARELASWAEKIELAYFRQKTREVDFVLTYGGQKYLPIEVKSGQQTDRVEGLKMFLKKYDLPLGVVITCDTDTRLQEGIAFLPLRYFLLGT